MNTNQKKKLSEILELHDDVTETFGNPYLDTVSLDHISEEELLAFAEIHGIRVVKEEEMDLEEAA